MDTYQHITAKMRINKMLQMYFLFRTLKEFKKKVYKEMVTQ